MQWVIEVFGPEYLRRPTVEDTEHFLQVGEARGFPGMLGSIDCLVTRVSSLADALPPCLVDLVDALPPLLGR